MSHQRPLVRILAGATCIWVLGLSRVGEAQSKPTASAGSSVEAQAGEFFDKGTELYRKSRWTEAEVQFQKAWDLRKSFDVAANLGDCELEVGQAREAAEHLAYALREFPLSGKPALKERLKKRFQEARAKVGGVQVEVSVPGAQVLVDGHAVGQAPLVGELFVEPGSHVIEAQMAGYESAKQEVSLKAGGSAQVKLALEAVQTKGKEPKGPTSEPPPKHEGGRLGPVGSQEGEASGGPRKEILIGGGVAAGAALVAGVVFTVVSNGKASDADAKGNALGVGECTGSGSPRCEEVRGLLSEKDTFGSAAVWSFVGAGLLGAGTAIYALTAPKASVAPSKTGLRATPVVSSQGCGLMMQGSF